MEQSVNTNALIIIFQFVRIADPFSIHSLSALDILLVEVHYKTRFHYEIVKELAIAEMSPS